MIKFQISWLQEWIMFNSMEYVIKQLTMLGFEVEHIEYTNIITNNNILNKIYIGQINNFTLCEQKTNLYKLNINIRQNSHITILSNDFINYKKNMYVIIATKQSILYKTLSTLPQYSFLQYSDGLLCAKKHLWKYNSTYPKKKYDIILPKKEYIFKKEYLHQFIKLHSSTIYVTIPYNRYDCNNIMGLARELSSCSQNIFLRKKKHFINKKNNLNIHTLSPISVMKPYNSKITKYLHQYNYCIINHVNLYKHIPTWMEERLRIAEIPISINYPLINISNYLLLELGYPVSFYDADHIIGEINITSNLEEQTIMSSNNNQEINIPKNLITMNDKKKILSVAGLCQNINILPKQNTKNIFIENIFLTQTYMKTLVKNDMLHEHIITPYIKGLDPNIQKKVFIRTIELVKNIYGGNNNLLNFIKLNKKNVSKKTIKVYFHRINTLLGFNLSKNIILNIITKLYSKILEFNDDFFKVEIPSWRYDITNFEDIVEDIIRIYGYDKIPIKTDNIYTGYHIQNNKMTHLKYLYNNININQIKSILVYKGYYEVINYSLVNIKTQSKFFPNIKNIKICNPISQDMSVMRNSLFYGLIKNIMFNQHRQQTSLRFFEYGLCFDLQNNINLQNISQKYYLSGIINGNYYNEHWKINNRKMDFYDLKGDIECILQCDNINNIIHYKKTDTISILHPQQSALIYLNNICIGYIGVIHPKISINLQIKNQTIFFELFCHKINIIYKHNVHYISKFPMHQREISFLIKKDIIYDDIIGILKKINIKEVVNINIFDVYEGKNIPINYKNITLSIKIQSKICTLQEEEINYILQKYIQSLKDKYQIILRDH
ncbi:phenylalanine--tRNA ligase subunit beta [Enterobacteriaceae endosymbiont of Macroplea appendiculata]|uniref:phenylalanine--tRNA ligase subunit beta n=1 Tax=Enterobacteriaceae endosymbiont of Macroplea appendiculata TaxID=2675790 RepID=UPI0014490EA5|nr:phenylalanine--tRNA ligase subunit beta [Enterobacteriaceae endosymbiont of Macroplea appendiculata]QJC30734.1 phenylalanine--tRNA ligase subunit beta [Enterobacteriaceae endosymbiont of Macroplea appendiculata]